MLPAADYHRSDGTSDAATRLWAKATARPVGAVGVRPLALQAVLHHLRQFGVQR